MRHAKELWAGHEPMGVASRRGFLRLSAAAAGTLLIGFPVFAAKAAGAEGAIFAPDAFIRIEPSGKITLIMPQVEMGQGIYTAVAMILAEELDAAFDQVTLEAAPPNDALYANPMLGFQATGGSTSVRAFWMPLRKAAAGARLLLVAAAAQKWGVDPATCRAANSEVLHDATGRRLAYGALVGAAAGMTPPKDPPLKAPADFQLVGKPLKRLDTPDKVNGKVTYGIDAMPPGVKFATLAACPVFGGKVGRVDDSKAKGRSRRPTGHRPGRSRRRRRRSHVGGAAGARSPRNRLERRRQCLGLFRSDLGTDPRRQREGRSRRENGRRSGKEPRFGGDDRGGLRAAASSPTHRWSR